MLQPKRTLAYLIYGGDAARIYQERTRVIAEVLPKEHRAENLTEMEPATGRVLSLNKIVAELISELATPSFFPEVSRVVVVEQLGELFGSLNQSDTSEKNVKGQKKKSTKNEAMDTLCRYLEHDLPETGNVVVFTAIEDPDKWRRINAKSKLYRTIQTLGRISQHKEPAQIFAFIDAFTNRDLATALRSLGLVLESDTGVASVFRMLTRQVRFLIQAKLLERQAPGSQSAKEFAAGYFPSEKGLNITLEPGFVSDKVCRMAQKWTLGELNILLGRLERFTKVVYPSINDTYVPDPKIELETMLIELCGRTRQPNYRYS